MTMIGLLVDLLMRGVSDRLSKVALVAGGIGWGFGDHVFEVVEDLKDEFSPLFFQSEQYYNCRWTQYPPGSRHTGSQCLTCCKNRVLFST